MIEMADIVDISANKPHITLEVICLNCHHRYQAVAPVTLPLKDFFCDTCDCTGSIIATGQWELP
jgi:hypothetical protein